MTASIAGQLAHLRACFPGWSIWYGTHTSSWWALPPGPPPGPDGWIEAASACALETALRSIIAAAPPVPDGHAGRGAPLAAPVPAPRQRVLAPAGPGRRS